MELNKNTIMLACDFETTVYDGQDHTEVWSAAYAQLYSDKTMVFHRINEFIKNLIDYRRNIVCWFHNERFDGTFIVNYLLKQGWQWSNSKKPSPGHFKTLISKQNRWYSITIYTSKGVIEIRDSVKLMPMSLDEMGKAFNTKHRKLNMEYKGYRYAGCPISNEELEYIINDVLVLKEALEYMISNNHTKLTIGSCALHSFKKKYSKYEYQHLFPRLDTYMITEEYGSVNADEYIRKSYKGGYCYLRPDRVGRHERGKTLDVNSLYPSVMHSQSGNSYPIGEPHFWEGDIPPAALRKGRLFFITFECSFNLKDKHLPTVQIKGDIRYKPTEWLVTSDIVRGGKRYTEWVDRYGELRTNKVRMCMTNVDWKLFNEHYDIYDLKILSGCWFYSRVGMFDEYIDYWMSKKMNAKSKGERTEAKLFLNNLYGKFATSTDSSYREPVLRSDGSIDLILHEENDKQPGYIAVGSFVTSYAREFTIRRGQLNYDYFIYSDTDSLHMYEGEYEGIDYHESKLLCWKQESDWSSGYFLRQKTYCEFVRKEEGKKVKPYWDIKCAGMPERSKKLFLATHPITDFKFGLRIGGKLIPTRIPGGVVLKEGDYTLRKK